MKIKRSHFFTFVLLTLGALMLFGLCRAVLKIVGLHLCVLPEHLLYTPNEIERMVWTSYAFLVSGLVLGVSAVAFLVRTLRYHRVWAVQRKDIIVTFPMIVLSWYLLSFVILHTANTAFTHLNGTTPYCYPDPCFQVYEPLSRIASHFQWLGKGNRYAREWIKELEN